MTIAIAVMLSIGATCGIILSIASKAFYVYEDPRISKVEYLLAGANCGGCGFAGCSAAAVAVVNNKALPSVCIVSDSESVIKVAEIMGIDPGSAEPKKSITSCKGGDRADNKFLYNGVNSCSALSLLYGGEKLCSIGCLGFGDCVKSCQFDAISIAINHTPVVNLGKCVGCGACENACPKDLIKVKTMSERLLSFNKEKGALAPCRQTCPAEIDIPAYISKIRSGEYEEATNIIRERNPLLLSCGRVCPHPCEDYCRRGIEDEAVSINQLKRFLADYEMNNGKRYPIPCAPFTNKKVAVIGGGPAGLSAAYFLRRLGHEVTIFESMPKLGGIIRYGIPEYRLPKKVLDWEIEGILNLGINSFCNKTLGVDFTVESLLNEGYNAIFMGIGAWSDYSLGVEGEDLKGCWQGINFLSSVANDEKPPIGKKVAVVGGGNSAIDCVRTLVRLGADQVTIVYRRTRNEMPANEVEIQAAEHEKINFKFLAAPLRVIGNEEGYVTHLEYLTMELGEPDASGRCRPVPIEGSESKLEIDMLITAIGQRPKVDFVQNENDKQLKNLKLTRWNTIDNNPETFQSSLPYIFTAGDCATGPSLVVDAIGGARKAVNSIHKYLLFSDKEEKVSGEVGLLKKDCHIKESIFECVPGIKTSPRTPMPELPASERINSMKEVDLVISDKEAIYEANRCLECCRLCYNKDNDYNAVSCF